MGTALSVNDSSLARNDAWYRQFYVWLIIFLPACAVAASFATLYIAAQNPPELSVSDYSDIEAIVAQQAAQDREAAAQELLATLDFGTATAAGAPVAVHLQARDAGLLPETITLRVVHSTQAAQDASAELSGTAGQYAGTIQLPAGRYELIIEDPAHSWRLTGRTAGQPPTLQLSAPNARAESAIEP